MIVAEPTLPSLANLPAMSLLELQSRAAFLTRKDRKYLVPLAQVGAFVADLGAGVCVLDMAGERTFTYHTTYFDDAHFTSYFTALRQRPNRFKVRTRLYVESGRCLLEVKVRDARGQTVKHQTGHDSNQLHHLTADNRHWLESFPQVARHAPTLLPCVTTTYRRSTLALANGAGRVTIDRDLGCSAPDGEQLTLPGLAIIETKSSGPPTHADRLLWRQGFRPQSMSKFAISLSLLTPELPANRWHRLRNRLDALAERTAAPFHTTP